MDCDTFRDEVMNLPVFDTHTHLNMPGVPVTAQNVWDVMHYFWFQRELIAAGYPAGAKDLDENARYVELAKALDRCRNTTWNRAVRSMALDLYDVRVDDGTASLRKLDESIRASGQKREWAGTVARRIGIKRITVNDEKHADLPDLPGVGCALPSAPVRALRRRHDELTKSNTFAADLERHVSGIRADVADLAGRGVGGVRVDGTPYDALGERTYGYYGRAPANALDADHLSTFLFDALFDALNEHEMLAQMFLGMRRGRSIPVDTSLNDPGRIVRLHKLFHRHPGVRFELVMGCELNNMDVVQAARMYPNVNPGGLWWFNFRVSSYLQSMQYRLEALPACRSALVATDARCIEWAYTKTLVVKDVMAGFLWEWIQKGWIGAEDALAAAKWWLHDTAAELYVRQA